MKRILLFGITIVFAITMLILVSHSLRRIDNKSENEITTNLDIITNLTAWSQSDPLMISSSMLKTNGLEILALTGRQGWTTWCEWDIWNHTTNHFLCLRYPFDKLAHVTLFDAQAVK